jgi:DNA-binding transcriptional MerR regulator
MKISELSERSGVPLPTIKFYIREGILPPGRRTAKNQADYTDEHVERLLLVRALRDDAGLPVTTIANAMKAADGAPEEFVGAAIDALQRPGMAKVDEDSPEFERAMKDVLGLVRESGWDLDRKNIAVRDVARAWTIVLRSYPFDGPDFLRPYLEVADRIAKYEIPDSWEPSAAPNATLRYAVLGTVLFEPIILSFRRMAHTARARELERRPRPDKPPGRGSRAEKKAEAPPQKRRQKRKAG